MQEYPGNAKGKSAAKSSEPSAEEKNIRPLAAPGEAKLRKKPLGRRFKEAMIGEDGRTVANHVLWDVIIPSSKTLARNAAMEVIDRALFGESGAPRNGSVISTLAGRINYAGVSTSPRVTVSDPRDAIQAPARQAPRTTVGRVDYQDIVLGSRALAEETIDQMNELISRFGKVSIADLFDIVGITGEFTDNAYGWQNLNGARVDRVPEGYILVLPRPIQF